MHAELNRALADTLYRAAVVPVLTIEAPGDGVEIARALARGGIDLIEVTLRTPAALEAIRRIRAEVPHTRVGAGTVLTPEQGAAAIAAGSRFLVSPGITPRLIEASFGWSVPFLPGAVTASEAMALADLGFQCLKFFPAEAAGGASALRALASPLAGTTFCPTGGIDRRTAADYLGLANVVAVGGSWLTPRGAVAEGRWHEITALAEDAVALRRRG